MFEKRFQIVIKKNNSNTFFARLMNSINSLRTKRVLYMAAIKRSVRLYNDKFNHIIIKGNIKLPDDFLYEHDIALPRGKSVEDKYFSSGYEKEFNQLPKEILDLIKSFRSTIEIFFADDINVRKPFFWKNWHIPQDIYGGSNEIFSDAFHQDIVFDQYNMQLFILLHDVTEDHGPFEYLDKNEQIKEFEYYRNRDKRIPKTFSNKLVGKRGDFLLFSTGTTLHRASNPSFGYERDIMSIAFFPKYTGSGTPIDQIQTSTK